MVPSNLPPLLIRADGSSRLGTGHVMRCLALAQGWQHCGGQVAFVMAEASPALLELLDQEGVAVHQNPHPPASNEDALWTAQLALKLKAPWLVLDGYEFQGAYQASLHNALFHNTLTSVMVVDDYVFSDHYHCDLIVNGSICATAQEYQSLGVDAHQLLGTDYVFLRREYWQSLPKVQPHEEPVNHILVTLGGADPDNITAKLIESFIQWPYPRPFKVSVLVGNSNPHRASLIDLVKDHPGIELLSPVQRMSRLLQEIDVGILAGGTTCWEALYMGLPIAVTIIADNQKRITQQLAEEGFVLLLGEGHAITPDTFFRTLSPWLEETKARTRMGQKGQRLIDGQGVFRVIQYLLEKATSKTQQPSRSRIPLPEGYQPQGNVPS